MYIISEIKFITCDAPQQWSMVQVNSLVAMGTMLQVPFQWRHVRHCLATAMTLEIAFEKGCGVWRHTCRPRCDASYDMFRGQEKVFVCKTMVWQKNEITMRWDATTNEMKYLTTIIWITYSSVFCSWAQGNQSPVTVITIKLFWQYMYLHLPQYYISNDYGKKMHLWYDVHM